MAAGVGVCGYSIARTLYTNPDVTVTKASRLHGPVDSQTLAERAEGFSKGSFYRKMLAGRNSEGKLNPRIPGLS